MLQVNKIMVAVPPTELASVVIDRARSLAALLGSELRLLACVYDPYVAGERLADSPDLVEARETLVEARREQLAAAAAECRGDAIPQVSVTAVWAYPVYEGITRAVEEYGADLLVAGTFHHSPFQRLGLTNTDWQLIRRAPCPVLLVRGDHFTGYDNILVPVDPMHAHDKPASLDDELLSAAEVIGRVSDATIQVLHCYLSAESLPLVAPGAVPAVLLERDSSEARHRAAVDTLVRQRGIDAEFVHVESGDARQLIPEFAERCQASLVVMGSVSRSRLRQLLIGSTAESVLDRLECDVLVIKPAAA